MFYAILGFLLLVMPYSTAGAILNTRNEDLVAQRSGISQVKAAWYAGWDSSKLPLDSVPWSKYTHMTYAFALTTSNGIILQDEDQQILSQFVSVARAKGVKALLSVGGWTGSRYFSDNVASATKRAAFVKVILNATKKYELDGIDFDWEYPNAPGIGNNHRSSSDTANFLTFLRLLRSDPVGKGLILTAAVYLTPFLDATGTPRVDVSGFTTLDWVAIMNYDVWGPSWSPLVGPNAPLNDSCASPGTAMGSATTAVAAWVAAGMPRNKIVLGVASYGYAWRVRKRDAYSYGTTIASNPIFDSNDPAPGDIWDGSSAIWNYRNLINEGWLTTKGTAAKGLGYKFGSCSKTAYLYNPKTEIMITFDDMKAIAAKGSFIKDQELRGFAFWEAAGDYGTQLLDSITKTMTS